MNEIAELAELNNTELLRMQQSLTFLIDDTFPWMIQHQNQVDFTTYGEERLCRTYACVVGWYATRQRQLNNRRISFTNIGLAQILADFPAEFICWRHLFTAITTETTITAELRKRLRAAEEILLLVLDEQRARHSP